MSKKTKAEVDRLLAREANPFYDSRCVMRDGDWWCPRHQGRPRGTLDTSPPYCWQCHDEIAAEIRAERRAFVRKAIVILDNEDSAPWDSYVVDGYTYISVQIPQLPTTPATFSAAFAFGPSRFYGPVELPEGDRWRDVFARGPWTMPKCKCPTCLEYRIQILFK